MNQGKIAKRRYRISADVGKELYFKLRQAVNEGRYKTISEALRAYIEGVRLSSPRAIDEDRSVGRLLIYVSNQLKEIYETHVPHLTLEEHAKLMVVAQLELLDLLRQATGIHQSNPGNISGEKGGLSSALNSIKSNGGESY